jgi:hypothetical protein
MGRRSTVCDRVRGIYEFCCSPPLVSLLENKMHITHSLCPAEPSQLSYQSEKASIAFERSWRKRSLRKSKDWAVGLLSLVLSGVIGHKDDPSFVSYVHVCVPLTHSAIYLCRLGAPFQHPPAPQHGEEGCTCIMCQCIGPVVFHAASALSLIPAAQPSPSPAAAPAPALPAPRPIATASRRQVCAGALIVTRRMFKSL